MHKDKMVVREGLTNNWKIRETKDKHMEIKWYASNIANRLLRKSKGKLKNYLEANVNEKNDDPKPMGCIKCNSRREVYDNTTLLQEMRKTSNKKT